MPHTVEHLLDQVLKQTEAIVNTLGHVDPEQEDVESSIVALTNEREEILQKLYTHLLEESNPESYQAVYQQIKQKEEEAIQIITARMGQLEAQLQDAKQKRSFASQYDSYFRLMPFGAFFDQKK
ncbi:hypothetical protein ACFSO0_05335 [Brevibacillus sp. GCM10020057]|uniref:hypothetical protein n=1 Tax=Brevibacillus sp. GCM10020057 TaxID=3317327 RepID=UPI00362A6412